MIEKLMLLFSLGWRNLWRNPRRTSVIMFAICLGVWAMITTAAFMRGIAGQMVDNAINNLTGHIQLHAPEYRDDPVVNHRLSEPDSELLSVLNQNMILKWSSRVRVPAVVSSEQESMGVILLGIDPQQEKGLSFISDSVKEGRYLENIDDDGLIVGRKLLERLETTLGKRIVVLSQDINNDIADRGFRITGVFDATLESTESGYIFIGKHVAQQLLKMGDSVSEIALKVREEKQLSSIKDEVKKAAPNADVGSWAELEPLVAMYVNVYDGSALVWYLIVFLAMAFGLVNTLLMAVFERTREFGIYLALGMKPRFILGQVWCEAFILLIMGLAIGNSVAFFSVMLTGEGIDVSGFARGMEAYGMEKIIPFVILEKDVFNANAIVIILGLLASLYPAWRAARMAPVQAINRA